MKIAIAVIAFIAVFVTLLVVATIRGPRYRVEVCMTFDGRSQCRTVNAKSEDAALRSAKENICAEISGGVTDTIKCENSEPQSVKWLQRP